MAFNDKEISTQDGRPAALYRLDWGRTSWFYTSGDRQIDREEQVNGEVVTVHYLPKAMKDSGMTQGSSQQNDFTVEGPSDLPIVRLFRGSPPSESIKLTVRRVHAGEADAPIYWKGIVQNVKRPTDAKCSIIGQPLTATMKRTGLRLCWTRECPHFLYDSGCKVNPETYKVLGEVMAFAGNTVTVTLTEMQDDGWFRGGFISWEASDEGTLERRFIETDSNSPVSGETTFTVFGLVDFIEVGDTVKAYPGCSRTPQVCDGKFDNIKNYGGFDKMPGDTPFGNAIW